MEDFYIYYIKKEKKLLPCCFYDEDAISMALPRGHAASTYESP
jgi:hypothetical protein